MTKMKIVTILLLFLPLVLAGCESGAPDDSEDDVVQQPNRSTASADTTYTSTQTSVDGTSPSSSGPPWEGDTKTESYTVGGADGNVSSGIRTYTYTAGAWVLTSDVGA